MNGDPEPVTSVATPWVALDPTAPPYVLPDDAPTVRAFNETRSAAAASAVSLDLTLLPEPWVGRTTAPVVILQANPGRSEQDHAAHARRDVREALVANMREEPLEWPLVHLDPALADTSAARWYRRSLNGLRQRCGDAAVARHVVALDFHGYHSPKWAMLPVSLPSQAYTFHVLREAVKRNAVIVAARNVVPWMVAVPSLIGYPRLYQTRTARSSAISPGNCPDGFDDIVASIIEAEEQGL